MTKNRIRQRIKNWSTIAVQFVKMEIFDWKQNELKFHEISTIFDKIEIKQSIKYPNVRNITENSASFLFWKYSRTFPNTIGSTRFLRRNDFEVIFAFLKLKMEFWYLVPNKKWQISILRMNNLGINRNIGILSNTKTEIRKIAF